MNQQCKYKVGDAVVADTGEYYKISVELPDPVYPAYEAVCIDDGLEYNILESQIVGLVGNTPQENIQIQVGQKYFINDPWEMGLQENYSHGDIVEIEDVDKGGLGWFTREFFIDPHWVEQGYAQLVEDAPQNNNERKNQYIRTITNRHTGESIEADIYDVLAAYNVTCPCMAHGIKKAMVPGERHSKSVWKDKKEAAWSIEESILLQGDKPDAE